MGRRRFIAATLVTPVGPLTALAQPGTDGIEAAVAGAYRSAATGPTLGARFEPIGESDRLTHRDIRA